MAEHNKSKFFFHFISHTHWDREWYLPFENFRFRLVQLIDNLMELLDSDPSFNYFHLDGQTIVLEDYYAIRPAQRARLEAFIREGRILIGPWYQQNDLFLTSAESTVRNLIEGIRTSRELGGEMKVGYLPDHFGLLGQMPQIFQLVGIDSSIFGRGYDYELHPSPFMLWRSPDGSEVTGILLTHWYNNAQRIPDQVEQLATTFGIMKAKEEKVNPLPHYLMMNGVDHLEAQENLSSALDKLRVLFGDDSEFIHDTLPNYVQIVQKYLTEHPSIPLPTIQGELRERFDYAILGGTLSSRVYIKQANLQCHDLIEKWAEPLSVWCALAELDLYDSDYFRFLWKRYMENHPHDSICGCSQDAVHEHMMDRFASIKEIANEIIEKKLGFLVKQVSEEGFNSGDQKLLIANSSQLISSSVLAVSVYFLAEDNVMDFCMEDDAGASLPYRIVSARPSRISVISPINLPGILQVQRFDIELQAEVPPLGYITYRIAANQKGNIIRDIPSLDLAITALPTLENNLLKVEVQTNGSLDMTNKQSGMLYRNVGGFEDSGDRGDLYVYTSVLGEKKQKWNGSVEMVSQISNELYDEISYRFVWQLPGSLKDDYTQRSEALAACSFQATLRLDKAADYLKIKLDIDNQVKDHRIRYVIPLPERAVHIWAGGQFDVVQRKWDEGSEFDRDCNAQPFWKWVAPLQASGGIAIFGKGTHEYEIMEEGKNMAITLLRCVENINVREPIALESDLQLKGQCIGQHKIELALRPFTAETATQLYREAELFHQGLRTKLQPVHDLRWEQGRAWVQDSKIEGTFTRPDPNQNKPRLKLKGTFIELSGNVLVSAVKWAEDQQGPVIRLYNVESKAANIALWVAGSFNRITRTNLLEEPQAESMNVEESTEAGADIASKKIVTFKYSRKAGESE